MATKEGVLEALKKVQDPEILRDIVSLGMVKNLESVKITMIYMIRAKNREEEL